MRVRVEITGDEKLLEQFRTLAKQAPEVVFELVSSLTRATHSRAVRGIQRGPATGRIYTDVFRTINGAAVPVGSRADEPNLSPVHQASAPGEYPMSDTGRLAGSVKMELPSSKKGPVGVVGTNLGYGRILEFKSAARGGRPWLMRSFTEATKDGDKMLARIFKRRSKL